MGNIRILNINTASRALFNGHTQRVTDMAFFAEDVNLLATASTDGKVFIWKIKETITDEESKLGWRIVTAIQIRSREESVHPRVCWHSHKQNVLFVAIGKRVLKIDIARVAKGQNISVQEPLKCGVKKVQDGVQLVGKHETQVTDLSICQWMSKTRIASASTEGTVRIWEDGKPSPLAVFKPHGGQPVNAVAFLTSPRRPDHIVLITAGPLNREVKMWSSASEEGWVLSSDAEAWQCTQTLDLRNSAEPRVDDAFFNQVAALPSEGLILLGNAKTNAMYAVHVEYGPCPAATRMDYIAEFTATMPILSLTGTCDSLPDRDRAVQVYCVETQAMQLYVLELSQCLPPLTENIGLEKTDCDVTRTFEASSSDGLAAFEASEGSGHRDAPATDPASPETVPAA
ncbi:hypothetical protein MKW92_008384 [Papaver armeniacum]|nr:hypothetical protein MKW92_008384 [Papaver armeniacum]